MSDKYAVLRRDLPELVAEAKRQGGINPRAQFIIDLLAERDELAANTAPQPVEPDEERLAMEAVMESIDPATWPGLTLAQRCALGRFAKPQPTEQQPAPDVAGLVEALTMARETIASALRANAPDYFTTDADIARHVVIQRIDTAIAAHRKQGGE